MNAPIRSGIQSMVVLLAGSLVACTAQQEQAPAVDLEAEAQAIRDVSSAWLEHVTARDLEELTGLFAESAVFFDENEPATEGLAAIRADIESEWAENPDFTVTWSTISVDVADSGDMAWERGQWEFDPDGAGEAEGTYGEYVTVYRKMDGAWKAVADIGSVTKPEEEAEEEVIE
jgi:uncharacterized protein (TIGR02246 family)